MIGKIFPKFILPRALAPDSRSTTIGRQLAVVAASLSGRPPEETTCEYYLGQRIAPAFQRYAPLRLFGRIIKKNPDPSRIN